MLKEIRERLKCSISVEKDRLKQVIEKINQYGNGKA
jgi:hypothetical protein